MIKKLLFTSFALAILATSCNKEKNSGVFTAAMEENTPDSKAYVDGKLVKWEMNDEVKLFTESDECIPFHVSDIQNGIATLDLNDGYDSEWEDASGSFYAMYPSATSVNHQTIYVYSEEHVPIVAGGTSLNLTPMMFKTSAKSGHLAFKNMGGLIKLSLTADATINRIDFSCDENICGVFSTNWNGGTPTISWLRNTNLEDKYEDGTAIGAMTTNKKSIIFSNTNLSAGKSFYMWLPAGTYTNAQITIHNINGTICTKNFRSMGGNTFTIGRNKIHPILILSLSFN